ncbi:hypothetical protein [Streptomyces sp. TS71-3]|uniref:hypothetical protein n=1 Tax=Streptomyces sp. TS71-3 TaxID=2733862 RepID=UPI001B11B437|nr:hypothetical protein [Streptomyces sp. TS71-3]GHJ36826.1 hypothetical protein Sm713_24350 [Streptomyces sp. TS71-3]
MTLEAEPTPRQHQHRLMWEDDQPENTEVPARSGDPVTVDARRERRATVNQIMDGIA